MPDDVGDHAGHGVGVGAAAAPARAGARRRGRRATAAGRRPWVHAGPGARQGAERRLWNRCRRASDRMGRVIRDAVAADAARCAEIYAPYVRDTAISFESEPPSAARDGRADRRRRSARTPGWCWRRTATSSGYAYGGPFMSRAAYQWATAVSVYLAPGRRRTGGGRALYEALFDRLAAPRAPHRAGGHRAAQRGQRRPAPRAGLRARRHLPAGGLEARPVARRRLVPAPARRGRRPARPAPLTDGRAVSACVRGRVRRRRGCVAAEWWQRLRHRCHRSTRADWLGGQRPCVLGREACSTRMIYARWPEGAAPAFRHRLADRRRMA